MTAFTKLQLRRWVDVVREDRDHSILGGLGVVMICLAVLASLVVTGCSNPSLAHAVDSPRALDALKTALDEWKNGADPKSLASSSTPMTVQDLEWAGGTRLVAYEILGDGKAEDANLRVRVKLTLAGGTGKSSAKLAEKSVRYLVGTSPQVTVFRDMLRR